jgi:hypothetical protein
MKFYERVLGFEKEILPDGKPRYALRCGNNKINLQDCATELMNKAQVPTFGSGDFCLVAAVPLNEVLAHLRGENVSIEGLSHGRPRARCAPSIFTTPTAISSKYRRTSMVEHAIIRRRSQCTQKHRTAQGSGLQLGDLDAT